jgi:hypothetical protein
MSVPCFHCRGRGTEPTALELFDGLSWTLRALTWPDDRIAELRAELREDEVLSGMPRWGGVDLIDSAGARRTIERFQKK